MQDRLNIKTLLLELTRKCNLDCKHCFRGKSENKYMSLELIDLIFKDVCRVNTLLLTGGEPLLALKQIRELVNIIKKERININECIIVTNATFINEELIDMLNYINERTHLQIRVSTDIFHDIELRKKRLVNMKKNNISILRDRYNVYEETPKNGIYIIDKIGKAELLNQEDIDKINSMKTNDIKYVLGNNRMLELYRDNYPLPKIINENVVDGTLNIDVNGNITPTYYSFDLEDKNSYSNIKTSKTLKMAIEDINY